MECKKHKDKPDYSCNDCCSKCMGELDDEIKQNPKLARQMDNSFLYPNEG